MRKGETTCVGTRKDSEREACLVGWTDDDWSVTGEPGRRGHVGDFGAAGSSGERLCWQHCVAQQGSGGCLNEAGVGNELGAHGDRTFCGHRRLAGGLGRPICRHR